MAQGRDRAFAGGVGTLGILGGGAFFWVRSEVRTQPDASKRQKLNGRAMWRHDLDGQFFW